MAEYSQQIQDILSQQDDDAADQMALAGYGQAGATIGAALAGQKADPRFYQQLQASAAKRMQAEKDRKMKLLSYLSDQDQRKSDQAIAQTRHDERMGLQRERFEQDVKEGETSTALADKKFKQREKEHQLDVTKAANQHEQYMAKLEATKAKSGLKQNPTQMKKQGLASIGKKAEDQYRAAVAKGKKSGEWDPTSYADWMDSSTWTPNFMKNDSAIEAMAAASSWADSFLRDESGAAIPEGERSKYYQIYFPQKGDSEEAVANKSRLRHEKMANALVAAGESAPAYQPPGDVAGPGTAVAGEGGRTVVSKQYSPSRNMTKIKYSDGTEETVDGRE